MSNAADSDKIDCEMQAIIASFHIEKAGVALPGSNQLIVRSETCPASRIFIIRSS
jgi:hypothetical protein